MTGIKVITSAPVIARPSVFDKAALGTITVASVAGSGAGKTDVSVSGFTLGAGEKFVYKIAESAAPAVSLGEILPVGENAWTAGTFPLDELTAASGAKITVAVVDSTDAVIASGNTTIVSND